MPREPSWTELGPTWAPKRAQMDPQEGPKRPPKRDPKSMKIVCPNLQKSQKEVEKHDFGETHFLTVFWIAKKLIWGSKMGPNSRPSGPQEAPRTLLEEAWQRRLFPDPFWGLFWFCFGPFGIVKIVLPSRRGATFYKNRRTRSGAQNRSQNEPQNELKLGPKWTPGGPRRAKSIVQSGARF